MIDEAARRHVLQHLTPGKAAATPAADEGGAAGDLLHQIWRPVFLDAGL
jgi:hypothetical protein